MGTREGLTLLASTPAEEGHPLVDVVFIHGINATADTNWAKDGHEWVVDDLPRDIKGGRILTFGYNSRVLSDPTFGRIRDFAKQLLEAILADRGSTASTTASVKLMNNSICEANEQLSKLKTMRSPTTQLYTSAIVWEDLSSSKYVTRAFIPQHSTRPSPFDQDQAMVLAKNDPRYSQIHQCSFGIIFLATPHRGSGVAGLAGVVVNIAKVTLTRPKTELLEQLKKDNQNLKDLSDDFRSQHSHFRIASFYELKDTDIGFFSPKLRIVSPESAVMDIQGEVQLPINANHRQICKFSSSGEAGYKSIVAIIKEFLVEAPETVNARLCDARRERILQMIKAIAPDGFQLPRGRLEELSYERLQGTCEWILQNPEIKQFLSDSDEGNFLCCYGKAGSGKTFMSSKVIQELQSSHPPSNTGTVIYFFCSINQVLLTHLDRQDLVPIVEQMIPDLRGSTSTSKNVRVEHVESALRSVIPRVGRCWLVIDAVDESSDPFSLMEILSRLLSDESNPSSGLRCPLKVLAFARQEYELGTTLRTYGSRQLEITPAMISQDIDLYIDKQIQMFVTRVPKRLQEEHFLKALRSVLAQKAEGMFLWVRMVVADLIEQAEEPTEDFIECLRQAPSGLHGIYEQYCERLATRLKRSGSSSNNSQLRRAQRCLKWLSVTHTLELGQMGVALSSRPPQENFTTLHENFQDGIEGPLRKCLGSLIEIRTVERSSLDQFDDSGDKVPGTIQVVSLIHDSLRLFLLKWKPTATSNVTLLSFSPEEANLEIAVTCLGYLTSNDYARQYSCLEYDLKDFNARFLLFAGRTWVQFAASSGGSGASSLKLLKLVSLYLMTSCEVALSAFDGLPYELPEVASEQDSDFLSRIDIRNFANCLVMLAEDIANEIPKLPEVERQVERLAQSLNQPSIPPFKCQAEHILEGQRILRSLQSQGVSLEFCDLYSGFMLNESTSKLHIPTRACEYGLKEIQARYPPLTAIIASQLGYFKRLSDSLHSCAVESNQIAIHEKFHSRFLVPRLTAAYRTTELLMGLPALKNLPSTAFHDWELYRRPRRDGYGMKYSGMARDSAPRRADVLSGDFLVKGLRHGSRLPSEAIAYFERFPFASTGVLLTRFIGLRSTIAVVVCGGTAAWAYTLVKGDATEAIAAIVCALPARLFPLNPSASRKYRTFISAALPTLLRYIPGHLSWMDLLRIFLTEEALRNYQQRSQIARRVHDLRVFPQTVLSLFPEISQPHMDPPSWSLLPPFAMLSFTSRCQRLMEPVIILLGFHLLGPRFLDFSLYLGLYRVGYALSVEKRGFSSAVARSWLSFLAVLTRAAARGLSLPESAHSTVFSTLLFLSFTAYDLSPPGQTPLGTVRGNMLFLLPAINAAWEYLTPHSSLNFWSLVYASMLGVLAVNFLQVLVLDPSGMLEAVSSLFSRRYLVKILDAKEALQIQKRRLRGELQELFQDES